MHVKIDQQKLFDIVKTINEKLLTKSARKKQFQVNVSAADLNITHVSSVKARKVTSQNIAKVVERYNEDKSLRSKDYHDITFHSIYIITLMEMYRKTFTN